MFEQARLRAPATFGYLHLNRRRRAGLFASSTLLFTFDPDLHFTGLVSWFDVHDARAAAHRAVFGVLLALAATQIDSKLIGLTAERAFDRCRGSRCAPCH